MFKLESCSGHATLVKVTLSVPDVGRSNDCTKDWVPTTKPEPSYSTVLGAGGRGHDPGGSAKGFPQPGS